MLIMSFMLGEQAFHACRPMKSQHTIYIYCVFPVETNTNVKTFQEEFINRLEAGIL
jgi:hypothetical protein